MTKKTENIIDIIFSLILIAGIVWISVDYENFMQLDVKPSGKSGKAGIILLTFLDSLGGKIVTISVIVILVLPYILETYKRNFIKNYKSKRSNMKRTLFLLLISIIVFIYFSFK